MTSTAVPPPASAFLEKIERSLPNEDNPCSRITLLRVLLLLMQVRKLADYILLPAHVFAALEDSIVWPSKRARLDLVPIISLLGEFDDALVAEIRQRLEELLGNAIPKPSLKQFFAEAFGAACADTDNIGHPIDGETGVKVMFGVALLGLVNALENFTAAVEVDISDERSLKAVEAFYTSQGFTVDYVDYANGLIRATKDGQRLSIKVSNYSGLADGYLLVTVKAA